MFATTRDNGKRWQNNFEAQSSFIFHSPYYIFHLPLQENHNSCNDK